jgi:UMP-CMP kinase
VQHFSAGDLLREEVKGGNNPELEAIMKEGKLVPMETTIALLRKAMAERPGDIFLIDGFPRALDQAVAFESQACALPLLRYACSGGRLQLF